MADLEKIAEDLSALSVLEAAELSKLLEEKWGVSAAAPVAVAAAPAAGGDAGSDAAEAKDSFTVVLASVGDQKNQRHQRSSGNHRSGSERGQRDR